MPKLNSFWSLAVFLSGLVILFINVVPYYKVQVVALTFGNETATNIITPAIDWMSQWAVVITLIVIIGLIIYGIVSYIINRRKPSEDSEETKAIKELTTEIKGLRRDLTNKGEIAKDVKNIKK